MEDLPPGFRFYPSEEELISFYLHNKLQGSLPELDRVIPVVDIYLHEPWELPRMAGERCRGEREQWFFFTPQQDREARGGKSKRTTATGYWKATGSPGYIFSSSTTKTRGIGVKKTMVFYKGRAPTGKKTHWKMNEYKAIHVAPLDLLASSSSSPIPRLRPEMSLCRVYITSGSSRAFDRRPGPSALSLIRDNALLVHQPPLQSSYDHQFIMTTTTTTTTATGDANVSNIAGALVLQESSTDSSGSRGDDRIRVQDQEDAEGSSNGNMMNNSDQEMIVSGLQPLWEWEQLNWP